MKPIKNFIVILTLLFATNLSAQKAVMKLHGTFNGNAKYIILEKINQVTEDEKIRIPVKDNKFYYETKITYPEGVFLFLDEYEKKGTSPVMFLFLEKEDIYLTIHSEEQWDKNTIKGGKLNAEYAQYQEYYDKKFGRGYQPLYQALDVLYEKDTYDSAEMKVLYQKLEEANGEERVKIFQEMDKLKQQEKDKSSEAKALTEKLRPIDAEAKAFRQKYIWTNPSIVSYFFLLYDLKYS